MHPFRRIVRRAEDFSGKGAARLLIVDDKIGERATDIDRYAKPAHASPHPNPTPVGDGVGLSNAEVINERRFRYLVPLSCLRRETPPLVEGGSGEQQGVGGEGTRSSVDESLGGNDDAIIALGAFARDVAVADILCDQNRITVERVAEAAAAAGLEHHDIAVPHGKVVGLERGDGDAAANLIVGTDRVPTAKNAPRRGPRSLEPEIDGGIGFEAILAVNAAPAAPLAGTPGIRPETVGAELDRVLRFPDLDRKIAEGAVDIVDQGVLTVAAAVAAPAPGRRFNRQEGASPRRGSRPVVPTTIESP